MALSFSSAFQYLVVTVVAYLFLGSAIIRTLFNPSGSNVKQELHNRPDRMTFPDANLTCGHHNYDVHILSRDPLVVLIPNFLSEREAEHLVELAEPYYIPSTVHNTGEEILDTTIRQSEKALLPRDHTVKCIEDRARKFQGWPKDVFVERLMAQKYLVGGHYRHHYDWNALAPGTRAGRVSSFMVYMSTDCVGGGTNFPRLEMPTDTKWCEYIDCSGKDEGVTFKPIKGAAVYWENFASDGRGYEEVWHAGMPVIEGMKIGLNIWNWYQPGWKPNEEGDGEGLGKM